MELIIKESAEEGGKLGLFYSRSEGFKPPGVTTL